MKSAHTQRLKTLAHKLNPVVIIGGNGLTDAVHREIEVALIAHELIKIRVNAEDKEEREEMTAAICEQHEAELVQTIGHVIVIFRADEEKAKKAKKAK